MSKSEHWLSIIEQFAELRNENFALKSSPKPANWSEGKYECLEIVFQGGEQLIIAKTVSDQGALSRIYSHGQSFCTHFTVADGFIEWEEESTLKYTSPSNVYENLQRDMRAKKIRHTDDIQRVNFVAYGDERKR